MKQVVDKSQKLFLEQLFNSIKVASWWDPNHPYIGVTIRTDLDKIDYPLNINFWDRYSPPSFSYNAPEPSQEWKVRCFIEEHFNMLEEMTPNNDWIEATKVYDLRNGLRMATFDSYTLFMDYEVEVYQEHIRAYDLIRFAEKKIFREFHYQVESTIEELIGEEHAKMLWRLPPRARTQAYFQMARSPFALRSSFN
jgi:hypothetical protein